jgi:hypothetical protein
VAVEEIETARMQTTPTRTVDKRMPKALATLRSAEEVARASIRSLNVRTRAVVRATQEQSICTGTSLTVRFYPFPLQVLLPACQMPKLAWGGDACHFSSVKMLMGSAMGD